MRIRTLRLRYLSTLDFLDPSPPDSTEPPTSTEDDGQDDSWSLFSVQSFALETAGLTPETIVTIGVLQDTDLPPTQHRTPSVLGVVPHDVSSMLQSREMSDTATFTTGDFSFQTAQETLRRSFLATTHLPGVIDMDWDGFSVFSNDTFKTAREPPPEILLALGLLMDPISSGLDRPQVSADSVQPHADACSDSRLPTDGRSNRQDGVVDPANSTIRPRGPLYDISFIRNAGNVCIVGSRINFVTNVLHYDDNVSAGLHTLYIKSDPTACHDSYERQKKVHHQMKAVRKWGSQLLITSSTTPDEFHLSVPRIKTRDLEEVVKDVFTWLYATSSAPSMMWLYDESDDGNSRTSLIAQFLANFLGERRDLTGSYFYMKPDALTSLRRQLERILCQ